MTLKTNARLAGGSFLLYIATGITSMVLFNRATSGAEGTAAVIASIGEHDSLVRVTVLLNLLCAAYALILGVTLHALTRDRDPDLALLGMAFRFAEGIVITVSTGRTLGLLWLATGDARTAIADTAAANALGAYLLKVGGLGDLAAICFAVGSLFFCCVFLRARSIPVALAWLGLISSVLWVVVLPLQLAGLLPEVPYLLYVVYIPMAVFEVALALWLIVKGVRLPPTR
jgi:hypothetical protein